MKSNQSGFTLVEIAIVLVIIGLLLGGILKGQELINSARVRNLADTNAGIQSAYYGFIDRYRQVPGDMTAADAQQAISSSISVGGNGNGQIDEGDWGEASALWVQLAAAGFIQGSYSGNATDASSYEQSGVAPINAFNGYMLLGRNSLYMTDSSGSAAVSGTPRLVLILGSHIPVSIARELDVKVDDQRPLTGGLRVTPTSAQAGSGTTTFATVSYSADTNCSGTSGTSGTANAWNIDGDAQNCNVAFIY